MDLYSILREIADSWVLLALFVLFLGIIAFAFRPGSRALHKDIADIPLRNGDTLESDLTQRQRSLQKEARS